MAKFTIKEDVLDRYRDKRDIKKKYRKLELKVLNNALDGGTEERELAVQDLKTIIDINHVKKEEKTSLMKVIGGWIGGTASAIIGIVTTFYVIDLGRQYDEKGIMNTSSVSKPTVQNILKSVFAKKK